jgi:palmitoyltransferase ZDHHC9/14/18
MSRPISPGSQAASSSMSPQRNAAPLPTPKGFYSPQKPAAALRLEQKEKRDMARRQAQAGETSGGVTMLSALAESTSTSTHGFNTFRGESQDQGSRSDHAHYRNSDQSISVEEPGQSEENRYPPPGPMGTSLTNIASHPHSSQRSSSDLVHRRFDKEKPSAELPIHAKPVKKERQRRYKSFENPLTMFFMNGHMVTGGDDWYSAILALFLLFAMTGVWMGTTGVWMWRHGSEYGLANGGGIAVTIVFVHVFPRFGYPCADV